MALVMKQTIVQQMREAQQTGKVYNQIKDEQDAEYGIVRGTDWPVGSACTYWLNGGPNQVGRQPPGAGPQTIPGKVNVTGYCVPPKEFDADVKAHLGKPCPHISGAVSSYNAKGQCIPNSTLAPKTPSSNTLDTPTIAEPAGFLAAGVGGIPTWMILAGGAAALFFFIRGRRSA